MVRRLAILQVVRAVCGRPLTLMKYFRPMGLLGALGVGFSLTVFTLQSSQGALLVAQKFTPHSHSRPQLTDYQLHRLARGITVKVETSETQGSGVIVRRRSGQYWVITNDHVALESDRFLIRTSDGQTHRARRVPSTRFGKADLTLLAFQTWTNYPVAQTASGLGVTPGTPVFSAGFPIDVNQTPFQLTQGQVSQVMPRSINGGYQVGYSNWVPKGMSGGPVMNGQGEVIAINGIHAEPLWGNPYVWDDGSVPSEPVVEELTELSWAIPIETVLRGMPR